MPNYILRIVDELKDLSTHAKDRESALEIFGKQIDKRLTLNDQGNVAPYLLDEWGEGPHWVNPTIPVYEVGN